MSKQSKTDLIHGHAANMQAAGEEGWPCGTMLFVAVLCILAFVVLPVMLGMGS